MKKLNLILLGVMLLTACGKFAIPEQTDTYKNMFETSLGTISPDQSWDFYASYVKSIGATATKAGNVSFTPEAQDASVDYSKWQTLLKSNEDNRDKGSTDFTLVSGGSFKVFPVWYAGWYPAYTKYAFEMGIVVDGVETKLFDGLDQNWEPKSDPTDYNKNPGTGAVVEIPSGTEFAFYIKYTENGVTTTLTSDTNAILLYSNLIDESKQMMVVGFEDKQASTWGTYNIPDFNDIVLYIEGNPYLPVAVAKRFMCEDCGTAGDFDFNDLVLDVQVVNAQSTKTTLGVTIQAAGGTRPLYVKVAGQMLGEVHELLGVSTGSIVNTGFGDAVSPYRTNIEVDSQINITNFTDVTVIVGDQNSTMYTFPSEGRAPYMIAVPIGTAWMRECNSIKNGYPDFFADSWMNNFVPEYLYTAK